MSHDLPGTPLGEFLEALAARTPTPGGGAVAGTSLATAAAIAHMALVFSQGRKSLAAFAEVHEKALTRLSDLKARGLELAAQDAAAYEQLNTLWKLPEDDPERTRGWDDAVEAAIAAPRAVLGEAAELLAALEGLVDATTPMLRSDLAVAAITAEAAGRSAAWNIRINLPSVSDVARADAHRDDMTRLIDQCRASAATVEAACQAD